MRIASIIVNGTQTLAVRRAEGMLDVAALAPEMPRSLTALLALGESALRELETRAKNAPASARIQGTWDYLPPVDATTKVLCLGLNYRDHAAEAAYDAPQFPVVFARFFSSFVGHEQPMILPACSPMFDWEAELAVVIGRRARGVTRERALDYVAGYTLFNDGSVRDRQKRTHQWTLGKNFDRTGPMGPEIVTSDELPPGAQGLRIQMRVNGEIMQDANTRDMIFDVQDAIVAISEAMTLEPGDVIAMGTPSGVGAARTPPRFLKAGDVCEVEVERVGILRNLVTNEANEASENGGK
ncbi:Fumarylacetoacetate hydrolase family protein [Labilithrix luteola]|uniref:Fumarylacetoacetate hydrolase family protein n=1 Tax=Labilithrix luteola TaxID=1391654 RepID=A0A0K1PL75_9BACT|nr:fumarylacetoacetate hydrolase family protein [Labilithrix luteola]AKU94283.1 Fumarylacetoacetate hydrolase family protein [Labilithrix luteola]